MKKLSGLLSSCFCLFSHPEIKDEDSELSSGKTRLISDKTKSLDWNLLQKSINQDVKKKFISEMFGHDAKDYDGSKACESYFDAFLKKMDWSKRQPGSFQNTVLLWAISTRKQPIIIKVINYITQFLPTEVALEQMTTADKGSSEKNTPLILSIKEDNVWAVKEILKCCTEEDLKRKNFQGNAAIHLAAMMGQNEIIKLILERAEKLGCKSAVIGQENDAGYEASQLYPLKFEDNYGIYQYVSTNYVNDQQAIIREGEKLSQEDFKELQEYHRESHLNDDPEEEDWGSLLEMATQKRYFDEYIGNFIEEVGKHRDEWKMRPKDKLEEDILKALTPDDKKNHLNF